VNDRTKGRLYYVTGEYWEVFLGVQRD